MGRRLPSSLLLCSAFLCSSLLACEGREESPDVDAETAIDGEASIPETSIADADGEHLSGPLAFILTGGSFRADRTCDVDGDGRLDNALADLGATHASLTAMTLSTLIQGEISSEERVMFYLPWVDDLSIPRTTDTTLLLLQVTDTSLPPDPSDDFSGSEPFFVSPYILDACVEPMFTIAAAPIEEGVLSGRAEALPVPFGGSNVLLRGASLEGSLEPYGSAGEVSVCAYLGVQDVGELVFGELRELTVLETLLAGGQAFGMPAIPGLTPDIDVDGDGVERFILDEELHIERCVDGDSTIVEGRDCWRDDRFVDGISVSVDFGFVSAVLRGPRLDWPWVVGGECDGIVGESSAWGPCPASTCERWESRPCTPGCGGDGTELCSWGCDAYGPCLPAGSESFRPSTCEEIVLAGEGGCGEEPLEIGLVDGPNQRRGFWLPREIPVGHGAVTIETAVRASRGASAVPGLGWAIWAQISNGGSWLGSGEPLGPNPDQVGYSLAWWFRDPANPDFEPNAVTLRVSEGPGTDEPPWLGMHRAPPSPYLEPSLNSSTTGAVEQRLRLIIQPDDPETDENEQLVTGQVVTGSEVRPIHARCLLGSCPAPIHPGDVLRVGAVAASDDNDALIDVIDFRVDTAGVCP